MIQGIHRYLKEESILLDLDSLLDIPEDMEELSPRKKQEFKKDILRILVSLFEKSGKI
ncbi:MAG: hypothetical protein HQL32_17900, partial [Planctomycetes bacterium]|nr:hypothetical protein [Planctomycetota bacterium]